MSKWEFMFRFSRWLNWYRVKNKITIFKMVSDFNVSLASVRGWLGGDLVPDSFTMILIFQKYGVPPFIEDIFYPSRSEKTNLIKP